MKIYMNGIEMLRKQVEQKVRHHIEEFARFEYVNDKYFIEHFGRNSLGNIGTVVLSQLFLNCGYFDVCYMSERISMQLRNSIIDFYCKKALESSESYRVSDDENLMDTVCSMLEEYERNYGGKYFNIITFDTHTFRELIKQIKKLEVQKNKKTEFKLLGANNKAGENKIVIVSDDAVKNYLSDEIETYIETETETEGSCKISCDFQMSLYSKAIKNGLYIKLVNAEGERIIQNG